MIVDNYNESYSKNFSHFIGGHSWGAELKVGDLYDAVDIELEAFNIVVQAVALALYSIGQPLFQSQIDKSKVIMREGASCSLCFKRRQAGDDANTSTKKSGWDTSCERIRDQCEKLARDEAAKIANRTASSMGERDALNFMF